MQEQKLRANTAFLKSLMWVWSQEGDRTADTRAGIRPVRCKSMLIILQRFMTSISQSLLMNYIISYSIMPVGERVCAVYMLMMNKWLSISKDAECIHNEIRILHVLYITARGVWLFSGPAVGWQTGNPSQVMSFKHLVCLFLAKTTVEIYFKMPLPHHSFTFKLFRGMKLACDGGSGACTSVNTLLASY